MEPVTIALICAAAFGAVAISAAFIRHIMLSRDKGLNDGAQSSAIEREIRALAEMRMETPNNNSKQFAAHYFVMEENKRDAMSSYNTIENLFREQSKLINDLPEKISVILKDDLSVERKELCERLIKNIEINIDDYTKEIKRQLDQRKEDSAFDKTVRMHLLNAENTYNAQLYELKHRHSELFQVVWGQHTANTEAVAIKALDAGTMSFKDLLMAPIYFLMSYFGVSPGISLSQTRVELVNRDNVGHMQDAINNPRSPRAVHEHQRAGVGHEHPPVNEEQPEPDEHQHQRAMANG